MQLLGTVKTDDVTKGRKDVDLHRRFRGGWVNTVFRPSIIESVIALANSGKNEGFL